MYYTPRTQSRKAKTLFLRKKAPDKLIWRPVMCVKNYLAEYFSYAAMFAQRQNTFMATFKS